MATLRQRPTASNSPSPAPPAARPSLSRTQTGDQTPTYSIPEDEMFSELFSGLGLLDLLVVVDAHLELWTRGIRKTSVEWKCVLPLWVGEGS